MGEMHWFFQENNHLPQSEKVFVSERFTETRQPIDWEIRAVSAAELQQIDDADGVCAAAVVFPDLKEKGLLESYQADDEKMLLKKMLTPVEYYRLLSASKILNGYQERKQQIKEKAKN